MGTLPEAVHSGLTTSVSAVDLRDRDRWTRAVIVMRATSSRRRGFSRAPLARLLAINLAIGAVVTVLLVGGLLALNPSGLRDLIFADRSPGVALGLLLMSFFITFGSTAMGTAIMALGQREKENQRPRGPGRLLVERLYRAHRSR
jgi:hypothetical protein